MKFKVREIVKMKFKVREIVKSIFFRREIVKLISIVIRENWFFHSWNREFQYRRDSWNDYFSREIVQAYLIVS